MIKIQIQIRIDWLIDWLTDVYLYDDDNDDDAANAGIVPCKSGYSASSLGVSSAGGSTHPAVTDLTQCQLVCSLSISCVGIDYDFRSRPVLCVTHDNSTFVSGRTRASTGTVVQYTKVDTCATSKSIPRLGLPAGSGPDYPLCRLYHVRAPRRQGPPISWQFF